MKTLKITLSLVVVVLLTVSVVSTDTPAVKEHAPTYKEYTPKDPVVLRRKKLKLESQV